MTNQNTLYFRIEGVACCDLPLLENMLSVHLKNTGRKKTRYYGIFEVDGKVSDL